MSKNITLLQCPICGDDLYLLIDKKESKDGKKKLKTLERTLICLTCDKIFSNETKTV